MKCTTDCRQEEKLRVKYVWLCVVGSETGRTVFGNAGCKMDFRERRKSWLLTEKRMKKVLLDEFETEIAFKHGNNLYIGIIHILCRYLSAECRHNQTELHQFCQRKSECVCSYV